MIYRTSRCALLVAAAFALNASPARAGWQPNGVPVCLHPAPQYFPAIASDGNGGTYVTWNDNRNFATTKGDFYLQRITASGDLAPGWPASGLPLCTAPGPQYGIGSLVADGEGGVLATWSDRRNGTDEDIYVQRMTPSGSPAPGWPVDGVRVTDLPWTESYAEVASDGAGGAFVAWQDTRDYVYPTNLSDIYAMHLLADGTRAPGWPANGLAVSTGPLRDYGPKFLPDGSGGVIMVWWYGDFEVSGLRAIRLTASGAVAPGWVAGGKPLGTASRVGGNFHLVSDGLGGSFLAWDDFRTAPPGTGPNDFDPYADIYALRLTGTADVAPGWPSDGLPLCTLPNTQWGVNLTGDGSGGCFVAWVDYRDVFLNASDVYALRVRGDGTLAPGWTAQGTRVSTAVGYQLTPKVVADGVGGVYLVYNDYAEDGYKVATQHLTGNGQLAPGWAPQGVRLAQVFGPQQYHRAIPDGMGGVIAVWEDGRDALNNGNYDIYAQRIGVDGPVPVLISLVSAEVEAGLVRLTWYAGVEASFVASVERRAETGEWERLGSITTDGSGTLTYEDRAVTPGTRYAYRLAYPEGDGTGFTTETWVTVPALRFALRGLTPNPSAGDPVVAFSLVSAEPASLELFDLHGRLVLSREVGTLGVGAQSVRLEGRGRLAAGVYTVRLRQGTEVATARAVIVR